MDICQYPGTRDLSAEQISLIERNAAHDMARRGLFSVVAYATIMAVLIFASPYAQQHPLIIYSATLLFALSLGLRLILLWKFVPLYERNPQRWQQLRYIALMTTSMNWGIVSAFAMFWYDISWTTLITSAATASLCAGGILSLAMDKRAAQFHVLVILLPNALFSAMASAFSMAIFFLTYLAFCLLQIRHVNNEYWTSRINTVRLDQDTRQRLHDLTYFDTLTGLPNRNLFSDRLQQALFDAGRNQKVVAVLFIGLDRFKQINDTLGHSCGDQLITDVANRIASNLRENDTLARYSGDTFVMVLPGFQDVRDVARVATKLNDEFGPAFSLNGLELFISASIGITVYPNDSDSAEVLIKNAEAAMYRVKENGGNHYQYFEKDMNTESLQRLQLETDLRHALNKSEFILHYQPKVDLTSGCLSGFEALLRWHPQNGQLIGPDKFIPVLEDTGLIVSVGEWVLKTACQQARLWQQRYGIFKRMAVNLSARQLKDGQLIECISRILDEVGLEPRYLELEITESMLIDNTESIMQVLQELNNMGIHLSIDDFGTGYSSLSYLKRMPIHSLKIDRSFVHEVTTDINDAAVVETIIAMAHILNLKVVAEGTETIEQILFLQEKSCDETQGFYFSKPLPAEDIIPMLEIGAQMLSRMPFSAVKPVARLQSNKPT